MEHTTRTGLHRWQNTPSYFVSLYSFYTTCNGNLGKPILSGRPGPPGLQGQRQKEAPFGIRGIILLHGSLS